MENVRNGFTTYDCEFPNPDWTNNPVIAIGAIKYDADGQKLREKVWTTEPEQEYHVQIDGETTVRKKHPTVEAEIRMITEFLDWVAPFEQPMYGFNPYRWDLPALQSRLGQIQCKQHIPRHLMEVEKLRRQTRDLMPAVAETLPMNGDLPNTLEDACSSLGIDHDTYDDEDDVYSLFQEGRTTKLKEYLLNDLEMTGELATRLRQQDLIHR